MMRRAAALMTLEQGKPLAESKAEATMSAEPSQLAQGGAWPGVGGAVEALARAQVALL